MTTKITLIINNPSDVGAFDADFSAALELARQLPALRRYESGKVWPHEDGQPTPAYRTLDLHFETYDDASAAVASAAAQTFFAALTHLTGGQFTGLFVDIGH